MPVTFNRTPKYNVQPAFQDPVVENGQIVGWIIRFAMSKDGIVHTIERNYQCEPDEVLPEFSRDTGPLLEKITQKLVNEHGLMDLCEQGLEERLASLAPQS